MALRVDVTSALNGKTALVTGAGRGIGRATAIALAATGVNVAIVARSRDQLDETAARIRGLGGSALVIQADLGEADEVARTLQEVRSGFEAVDILVNNAAVVSPVGPSVTVDPAEWAVALAINVTTPATLSFALLGAMMDQGWGRVVNVSSGIAAHPAAMIRANAYATTKAALEAHTLNLAAELQGTGVTVNAFRPGGVDTAMQAWIRGQDPDQIGSDLHDRFLRSHEDGALITPETSARSLVAHLYGEATGMIWDVSDPI
jgi:NAD(P)-dependent dehydrogenase (short-subunit alcohol dehydrogenase family)